MGTINKIVVIALISSLFSCDNQECEKRLESKQEIENVRRDTVNLNGYYTISPAVRDGHEYLLYESCDKYYNRYAFCLEHKLDCKKCLEQYE